MNDFAVGDRVRVDIPDETEPAHRRYHGRHGTIIAIFPDSVDAVTEGQTDDVRLRVDFDEGDYADFSVRELRPPITE